MDDDDLDEYERDAREEERDPSDDAGECIGAACCNPHPYHGSDECETVEMYEAWAAYCREQERRERWPRLHAALDWFARGWRALRWRERVAARVTSDDSGIPF